MSADPPCGHCGKPKAKHKGEQLICPPYQHHSSKYWVEKD